MKHLLVKCNKPKMAEFNVGTRVVVDYSIGTVKFIGLVPPSQGEWIGLEWDEEDRGKHDGSKNGVTYFTCRHPTGGSFVRRTKINLGISLCEAIKDKYLASYNVSSGDDYMYIATQSGQKKVDAIALEKNLLQASELIKLRDVILRGQSISSMGAPGELNQMTPNIVELNLSKNLLSSWLTVCHIADELPHLQILNIGENMLAFSKDCLQYVKAFSSIKTLVLNKCDLTWNEVLKCAELWPNIEQLHLEQNNITDMRVPPETIFRKLQFLNLCGNNIKHWEHIRCISGLPNLTELHLSQCGLSKVELVSDEFVTLKYIALAENLFETHRVFDELNKLPSLNELRFRNNLIHKKESLEDIREAAIGKIGRLARFNANEVTERERCSCELDYLKKYGLQWKDAGGDQDPEKNNPSEEFLLQHPRYMELVAEYGAPADHELIRKSTALKGNLVEVSFRVADRPDFKPVTRRLPLTMTVGNVKMLAQRIAKVDVRKMKLVYISKLMPDHVISMDRDFETLHDISIEPGDTIEIMELTKFDRMQYIAHQRNLRMFPAEQRRQAMVKKLLSNV